MTKKPYALYLILERDFCQQTSWQDTLLMAIKNGVTLVQLREKEATTREFLRIGREVKALLQPYAIPLIINDRIDVALALDAHGVHLGQSEMPYLEARKILGKGKIIGITINSLTQAEQANAWDVDYLGVGPVFPTSTKLDATEPLYLSGLQKIRQATRHVLVAIGGINASNAKAVLATGADGIAVVSAICGAADPGYTTQALSAIIKGEQYAE